ncbi:MAG: hypothetical protein CMP39_04355 [Rickettsiales bacterium]|nr:hypothetical protein [Rickettsiales bacterium]|tara:strand:- start:373 stop:1599 length:1227 start_codon:yes stop_codon:yes gene_type:complete
MANWNYTVTVSGGKYYLNGSQNPTLTFAVNDTVTFDLTDSTNSGHPLGIGPNNGETGAYGNTEGVTYTIGSTNYNTFSAFKSSFTNVNASISWTVSNSSSSTLYYFCGFHSNMGNSISITGLSDATPPANASISINSGANTTTTASVTLSISATDNIGVDGYFASETNTTPSISDFISVTENFSYSANVSFNLSSGDGLKTVYVWFKDAADNISIPVNDSITLATPDTTAPTNGSISIAGGLNITSTQNVAVTISGTDNIGIDGYYLSEAPTTPTVADFTGVTATANYNSSLSYTLSSGNGNKTVYLWFKDAAGNISNAYTDSIQLNLASSVTPASSLVSGSAFVVSTTLDALHILDSPVVVREFQRVEVNGQQQLERIVLTIGSNGNLICRSLVLASATSEIELHRP